MARITYADKEQHHASPLPDEQKWMHGDANEVKDSVNAVYDADAAATGEVMFNDGTGVGKSPDLLFDGILQVGAISDVGQLQLGGATDTAVGTVSSNGTLTVEGQDINVSAGAVTTVSGVVGVAINGETIVAEATNGVDISAASGVRILTANQPRLAFDEDGAMLVSEDAGTAGQFIKSNGPGAAASWADVLASGIANTPFFYLQSGSVTGIYREDGENGGRPKFSLITGNPALDLSAWSGTFWGVTIGGVLAYRSFDDVANPTLCTTWEAVSGAAPLPTTSPLYGPTVQDALEQVAQAFAPRERVWEGYMTQDGTDLPTVEVLRNTLGGTPVFTYVGPGIYTATLEGAFPLNKTSWFLGSGGGDGVIELGRCITIIPNGVGGNELFVSSGVLGSGEYTNGIYGAYFKITVKRP